MDANTPENTKMTSKKDSEYSLGLIIEFTLVTGRMGSKKDQDNIMMVSKKRNMVFGPTVKEQNK